MWATKLSDEAKKALKLCNNVLDTCAYQHTGLAHLLAGVINSEDEKVELILSSTGISSKEFADSIEECIKNHCEEGKINGMHPINEDLLEAMNIAETYAERAKKEQIQSIHIPYNKNKKDKKIEITVNKTGVPSKEFVNITEEHIKNLCAKGKTPVNSVSEAFIEAMNIAEKYAEKSGEKQIQPMHILYGMAKMHDNSTVELHPEESDALKILKEYNLTSECIDSTGKV